VNPGVWTEDQEQLLVWPGAHEPLGATWTEEATNFAVYAPEATGVEVCLFDDDGHDGELERRYPLTE
jgi:glycogen operon protein